MNALMSRMSPAATNMIRMDHSHVLMQFHKLEPGISRSVREATVKTICTALEIHAQLEEEIFYPALREVLDAAGIQLEPLNHAVPEHNTMKELIARIRSLSVDDPAQMEAVYELMRAVIHHVADEETVVLPAAEKHLAQHLSELGARMTRRRLELAGPRAAEIAGNLVKASPGKTALMVAGTLTAGALLVGSMRRSSRWQ